MTSGGCAARCGTFLTSGRRHLFWSAARNSPCFYRVFSAVIEHMFVSLAELAAERRALDAQEAAWLKKVAAYDRSGDWSVDGFLNAASALRATCRIDQGIARGHVELARKLEDLPVVAAA